jgi:hypothetical protein
MIFAPRFARTLTVSDCPTLTESIRLVAKVRGSVAQSAELPLEKVEVPAMPPFRTQGGMSGRYISLQLSEVIP